MSDIVPARTIIQVEEARYPAATSESFASRVGSSINHIMTYQYDHKGWVLNGIYGRSTAAQVGVDGSLPIFRDMNIVGMFMFNSVAGSSGTTEIDIKRFTASGGSGSSIFSVRPSITSAAGNNAYLMSWLDPAETLENPSGTTLPTFSVTQLNKGDALTLDFVSRQLMAESLTVALAVRPR